MRAAFGRRMAPLEARQYDRRKHLGTSSGATHPMHPKIYPITGTCSNALIDIEIDSATPTALPCLPPIFLTMTLQTTSLLSHALNSASLAITRVFRLQVEHFLAQGISTGSLTITRPDQPPVVFGETPAEAHLAGCPVATLHLLNPASFYARVAAQADIGFAEAYISQDFTVADPDHLVTVFRLLILNRDTKTLSAPAILLSKLGAFFNASLHSLNRNTLLGSRRNIEAHYDLSNELFATFLGKSWTYSCALFEPPHISLDDAQTAKIDAILCKARLTPDMHLLDIGSGWGELAIRAATKFGCRVTGITLSHEQLALARTRVSNAGVADRVSFELVDYRVLAKSGRTFDAVVSVEMAEAVGHEFLPDYFSSIDALLAEDGVVVLQVITTPEQRYDAYRAGTDFIQKHIFPGGICPSLQAIQNATASSSQLVIEQMDNIGVHYATTLKEWRRSFCESVKSGAVAEAGFDDLFVRKWVYYFTYCESGFATRTLGVLQMVLSRVNNVHRLGGPPECGGMISQADRQ